MPWASFHECADNYREEIDQALIDCDVFLLLATKSAFLSREVRRELISADRLRKPIVYYKLDNSTHLQYAGFVTVLAEKQFIQALEKDPAFDKVALSVFDSAGVDDTVLKQQERKKLIYAILQQERDNTQKWREKLWDLKIDSKGGTRRLSISDKEMLADYAQKLSLLVEIEEEEAAFKLNKLEFTRSLRSILAKRRIDKKMLLHIEKKRIQSSVSKSLANRSLCNIAVRHNYLGQIVFTTGASAAEHWLVKSITQLQSDKCDQDYFPPRIPNEKNTLPGDTATNSQFDANMNYNAALLIHEDHTIVDAKTEPRKSSSGVTLSPQSGALPTNDQFSSQEVKIVHETDLGAGSENRKRSKTFDKTEFYLSSNGCFLAEYVLGSNVNFMTLKKICRYPGSYVFSGTKGGAPISISSAYKNKRVVSSSKHITFYPDYNDSTSFIRIRIESSRPNHGSLKSFLTHSHKVLSADKLSRLVDIGKQDQGNSDVRDMPGDGSPYENRRSSAKLQPNKHDKGLVDRLKKDQDPMIPVIIAIVVFASLLGIATSILRFIGHMFSLAFHLQ